MIDEPKRLHRVRKGRRLFGVLGGVAEYFNIDPSWARLGYALFTVFTLFLPGIGLYLLMFLIVPIEPRANEAEPS